MRTNNLWGLNKHLFYTIIAVALILLAVAFTLNLNSTQETRALVADQFNQEQLVIARNITARIERELGLVVKELMALSKTLSADPFLPAANADKIRQSFTGTAESGVYLIEVVDRRQGKSYGFTPFRPWVQKDISEEDLPFLNEIAARAGQAPWMSPPLFDARQIRLALGINLPGESPAKLLFHIDVRSLLNPFMVGIRSGKSGYAWVIDQGGSFLYHPESEFIGKNAFEARGLKDPAVAYHVINFIQKEKMLKGLEGTDWYYSGWHRGVTGQIRKMIAYAPAVVSENPPHYWSVAVVAPISEIEDAMKKGYLWQFMLQGFTIVVIFFGAGTIMFFLMRWSQELEKTVQERTVDLKKSEEKYRSLVESAEDFIFTVDAGGNLQSLNSFTAVFFGGTPDDFLGRPLTSLFPSDVAAKQIKLIRRVHESGKSIRDEFQLDMGDSPIWLSANFMPLKSETGDISAVLCIARDITENKKLEKQLVNTEKLASIGTLAAGVAHEVNNPLGVILGFCDLLLRKADERSQEYEDLKTIERQGMHCKEVVENLLSFARLENADNASADLNQCLREIIKVVSHFLEMNNIELITEFDDSIPRVNGDPRQLQQVFLNLINNAVAAMENGGILKIRTFLDLKQQKAVAQFQDNGCGIKKEDMDRIFEPFFTTKPEGVGTGLGLFVSYGIITKFGGTIECASTATNALGKKPGTTLTIRLVLYHQEG